MSGPVGVVEPRSVAMGGCEYELHPDGTVYRVIRRKTHPKNSADVQEARKRGLRSVERKQLWKVRDETTRSKVVAQAKYDYQLEQQQGQGQVEEDAVPGARPVRPHTPGAL